MTSLRTQLRYLNPYEMHKLLINEYCLKKPGDTKQFERDKSKDRNDYHVIKENHRFLWNENEQPQSWEEQFAKKYYEKLFKEYCITDLSRYKENKIALRWRIEREVVSGKGQFVCGNKTCKAEDTLRSWEVNFAYKEQGEQKNALVKIRLCPACSKKLNYHSKRREIKRITSKPKIGDHSSTGESEKDKCSDIPLDTETPENHQNPGPSSVSDEAPWEEHKPVEVKTREEEMEDYLHDLLL